MAILLAAPATKPAEAAGLTAHMHLILQVSQDLGGRHWMFYEEFREWAAAKAVKVWGDLNLSIYGCCHYYQTRYTIDITTDFQPTRHQ